MKHKKVFRKIHRSIRQLNLNLFFRVKNWKTVTPLLKLRGERREMDNFTSFLLYFFWRLLTSYFYWSGTSVHFNLFSESLSFHHIDPMDKKLVVKYYGAQLLDKAKQGHPRSVLNILKRVSLYIYVIRMKKKFVWMYHIYFNINM